MNDPFHATAGHGSNAYAPIKASGNREGPPPLTSGPGFPHAVTDLIAAQALRTPDRIAVTWRGGQTWTYRELLAEADAIAHHLLERGVAHGELVGVCVPRRPEMLAAVLGVMRAGAAYVALDPAFPAERLRYMAEHAGIRLVLAWRAAEAPVVLSGTRQVIALEGLERRALPGIDLPTLSSDDLAYVLYTSGSTGQPKGVRILQRNLVNFLTSMRREPGITSDDVLCAVTTLSFDIAALELYLPLLEGARIVIATEAEQTDPVAFAALLRDHAVTVLQTTPTLLRLLLSSNRAHEVHGMKLLIGGEAMPRDVAETMLPHCRELWNMYGPTETTVWSTLHRVGHGEGAVPLGKPIANTTIHILDEGVRQLAEGDIGEIWIGGAGVADGYLKDPDKTAERFLPDPFAADGSRMYRTGDLGSLHDGILHFHGRADDQISLRGYRIEPGEIEAVALAEPGVLQAVAVALEIADGDKRLALYVVAESGPELVTRLRAALRHKLPAFMWPQHIDVLDALPRTPNGKIDRKALPLPKALSEPAPTTMRQGPDPLETALTAIWRELLKVGSVSPQDDFFDLGGDSLLAVRVFERMQSLTGINLPLATLMSAPTITAQVAAFRAAGAREPLTPAPTRGNRISHDGWVPLVAIQPCGTRPPLFLIHAIGGNVLNYASLARALGDDQPVYGIQSSGLDGLTPPLDSIPSMAQRYIHEVRALQPHGPYFLAGGSMGGMIAYEMAQQLRAQGEPVGLLAMMDTHGPSLRANVRNGRVPSRIAEALWGRVQHALDAVRIGMARKAGKPLAHALRYREIERAHYRALRGYQPRPYAGRATLFLASGSPEGSRNDDTLGWSDHIMGGLETIELPGDHDHLIEQPELRESLRDVLARAFDSGAD